MRRLSFLLLVISVFATFTARGAVTDEDIALLREQLSAMSMRLDALAAENAELKRSQAQTGSDVAAVRTGIAEIQETASGPAAKSWSDSIRLDGDFRYRYEVIDVEDRDTHRRRACLVPQRSMWLAASRWSAGKLSLGVCAGSGEGLVAMTGEKGND